MIELIAIWSFGSTLYQGAQQKGRSGWLWVISLILAWVGSEFMAGFVMGFSPLRASAALVPMALVVIPLSRIAPAIAGRLGVRVDRLKAEYFGRGLIHLGQHNQPTRAFDEYADRRLVAGALDEIAFPMPGHDPVFHLGGRMLAAVAERVQSPHARVSRPAAATPRTPRPTSRPAPRGAKSPGGRP